MNLLGEILRDRGSRYAVSGSSVADAAEIKAAITTLKRDKKYAKATHNTWAAILPDGSALKDDDGETGAGAIIAKMLEREGLRGHLVVVTRWYGGVHLGGDRFAHVVTSVRAYLAHLRGAAMDDASKR
jgi:putative IMPACT (imprinted ancient) family translation regulator